MVITTNKELEKKKQNEKKRNSLKLAKILTFRQNAGVKGIE